MAEVNVQKRTSQERGLTRREDYLPSRDFFSLDPFAMMRRLTEEMDRAFGATFGLSRSLGQAGIWSPPVEVWEHDNNFEIRAELPGMNKDDVKVECTDQEIIIEGERRREEEKKEGGVYRSERSYGRFYRAIPLPDGADPEKAKAEFKNGILQLSVPVSESKRHARRIPIQA